METSRSGRGGNVWFWVAVAIFLAAIAYVLVVAGTSANLTNAADDPPLLVFGVAGVVSLLGWWRDRASHAADAEDAQHEHERLEGELHERDGQLSQTRKDLSSARENEQAYRNERQRIENQLKENQHELGRERYLRERSERAREAEKDWRNELHQEVMRLSQEGGILGDPSNVPSMVLRLARTLVGAEKGLLLSRRDQDDDGKLDLLASEGFEQDPENSVIVQRFADKVIERDETLREENPGVEQGDEGSATDDEINNLVAIPIYLQDEFSGVLICANNPEGFEDYDDEVLLAVGDHAGTALQNSRLQGDLRSSYLATVSVLAEAIEVKDPLLRGHSEEVSGYVAAVADRLDLPPALREELIFGSLLHDIGKIGISERILLKPAELTPEERAIVELHPRIGYRLIQQVPALRQIAPAVLHHHERFDGGGYPSGLRGEQIPLEASLISIADSFSAMVSDRPYQDARSLEEACKELERCAGTQFDPDIVRIFVEEVRRHPTVPEGNSKIIEDPEIEVRRSSGKPLGQGPLDIVDNLTLLYTRRHLHETAKLEAQHCEMQGQTFGVILIELSGISEVNKTRGYAAGDEEIRTAARAVWKTAARLGGTAYRYGGNRLALIVPAVDEVSVELLAAEVSTDLQDSAGSQVAIAAWRPNESGDTVIERARVTLEQQRP